MTVLIVEDNPGIRRLLRRAFIDIASAIWECSDGADALTVYTDHRPDVVLMDVRMQRSLRSRGLRLRPEAEPH